MAYDDDFYDDGPQDDPLDFWTDVVGYDDIIDGYLNEFMQSGMSEEERQSVWDNMAEYLDWEYNIQLDEIWDWEEFRAIY